MDLFEILLVDPKTLKPAHTGNVGVFYNGELIETYSCTVCLQNVKVIESMLDTAFELGKDFRSKEIKKLLG